MRGGVRGDGGVCCRPKEGKRGQGGEGLGRSRNRKRNGQATIVVNPLLTKKLLYGQNDFMDIWAFLTFVRA